MLDKPTLDRSFTGRCACRRNPHIQTDPRNIARVARRCATPGRSRPANAAAYQARWKAFSTAGTQPSHAGSNRPRRSRACRWWCSTSPSPTCSAGWACMKSRRWNPSRGRAFGRLPGRVATRIKTTPARMVLRATYKVACVGMAGATRGHPAVALPFTVGGAPARMTCSPVRCDPGRAAESDAMNPPQSILPGSILRCCCHADCRAAGAGDPRAAGAAGAGARHHFSRSRHCADRCWA